MGYTYVMPEGNLEAGEYAKFSVFADALVTRPFGLVQRDFNLKQFFNTYPNTGGLRNDERVMDCICRLDVVLMGKTNHEYPLLTPIIPVKQLYDIHFDNPKLFMERINRWAIENRRTVRIGKLKWEQHYDDEKQSKQKFYECIDVLLNNANLKAEEIIAASNIVLADDTSMVTVLEPERIAGHSFDLRTGQGAHIAVRYEQTGETHNVSIGRITSYGKSNRLTNMTVAVKGPIVLVKSISIKI